MTDGQACPKAGFCAKGADACLIGLDLGTSALKGVLMDTAGNVLQTAGRTVEYRRPGRGRVEIDAGRHEHDVIGLIRDLAVKAPGAVRALAISGASGNTLLTDGEGRPLTPVISWLDRRTAGNPPPVLRDLKKEDVRRVTGWPCVETFPLAHLAWLRQHRPAKFRQAEHICMNTDWLLFRLTGKWVMDHSTATTFLLQDQERRRWHRPYLEMLAINPDRLSTLKPSGVRVGKLTPRAAAATGLGDETVAVTGCFDHPAAARAVGVLEPGNLLLSCGTSWVGFLPGDDREELLKAELLCDPFLSDRGGPWGGMFSVPAIGPVIDWYVENLIAPGETKPFEVFDRLAAQAEPGAGGLVVDLSDEPRHIDADRAAISRAVMEAAARALRDRLRKLRKHGFRFTTATLVGGPGNSPVWPGIIADITGLELKTGTAHAGARGAAILAGIGAGVFAAEARAPADPRANFKTRAKSRQPSDASISAGDREIYARELREFLPARIFDVHVHLFETACRLPGTRLAPKSCYRKFGGGYTLEQYLEWAREWLPEQTVSLNSFGSPSRDVDRDMAARYSGRISDHKRFFGLALVAPRDDIEAVIERVQSNRLVGYKPYLNLVDWKPAPDVTIEDMLPELQMRYANERGLAVMLHIPREQRLSDPVNQSQMVALCRKYPRVRVIFAHIGRAYYLNNVIGFLDGIAACRNAYIDTAMVNHEGVLEYAFNNFPRDRILFGSDAPIAMLRGKSVEINNQYAYLMGEDYEIGTSMYDARHKIDFTTFYYEQLRGIKLAAQRAGFDRAAVEALFFDNAQRLFKTVALENYSR